MLSPVESRFMEIRVLLPVILQKELPKLDFWVFLEQILLWDAFKRYI